MLAMKYFSYVIT